MGAQQQQTTDPKVSLEERLAEAKRDATTAQMHLESLTGRITTAVRAEDFALAQQLKDQLPDAREAYGQHAATAKALEMVLAELEQQRQAHEQQIAAEHRKVLARKHLDGAQEAERQGLDALAQVRADLEAGMAAIEMTVRRGYQLEGEIRQKRSEAYAARVELGELDAMPGHVAAPNQVSALVERSPALMEILQGRGLGS